MVTFVSAVINRLLKINASKSIISASVTIFQSMVGLKKLSVVQKRTTSVNLANY